MIDATINEILLKISVYESVLLVFIAFTVSGVAMEVRIGTLDLGQVESIEGSGSCPRMPPRSERSGPPCRAVFFGS